MHCTTSDWITPLRRSAFLPNLLLVVSFNLASCGSKGDHAPVAEAAPVQAASAEAAPAPADAPPPAASTAAVAEASQAAPPASGEAMTPANLDELLAPVALYPDALLAQVLAAASYPQEVMDGGNWLLQNTNLQGQALQDAAKEAGFGAPMQALVLFPSVVDMMCQNFDWTKQLGSAFNADQGAVMASVQRLRAQAAAVGNLKSTPQQKVETQTVDKQQVIVIQPADPKIIYVPTYNPQVVYVTPPPPAPVVGPTTGDVIAAGLIGFTAGVIVGSMFNNHNYYPYPNWGYGGVWYGGHPYSRNVYVYAPHYNRGYPPGYRPGYGYRPPPNYANGWNRASTLPAYNSSNYYNRFNGNQNQRPGNTPPRLVGSDVSNRPGAYRPPGSGNVTGSGNNNKSGNNVTINNNFGSNKQPGTGGATSQPAWKGQQQYQGSRPGTGSASQPPRNSTMPARPSTPGGSAGGGSRPGSPATRPGSPASPATRPANGGGRPASDRGFGGTGQQPNRGGAPSGGATPAGRPANSATRPATPPPAGGNRQTAFTGASSGRGGGGGAQSDRAASNRGQASVGQGGTRSAAPSNRQRGAQR